MSVYRDFPLSKWFAAALLAAAAQLAIAPEVARAECGDYVVVGGHADRGHADRGHADRAHADRAHADGASRDMTRADPRHSSPCSGPNCSNDRPRPMDEPTAPVETEVRQWGLMAVHWLVGTQVARFAHFDDESRRPRMAAGSVYRPPR